MVTTRLNLSMTEPQVRQIYAKQGDTGRVLDISLDQTPEDGTLRILRPDGVEVTSEAVTGGEVVSGSSFESLTEADVTELSVGIEPVQDLNGYDKPWVGGAGKNKLNFDKATVTKNGITFTNNGDGTYTVSGTATATTWLDGVVTVGVAQGTQLILSGCPSGGSISTYMLDTYGTDISITKDYGSGGTFTANGSTQTVRIVVSANVTMNNLVFKPMIRLATETDATFAPYSNICPITGHDEVRVTRTGKNLLDNTVKSGQTLTSGGVSCTINSDGSVAVSGTATAGTINAWFVGGYGIGSKVKRLPAGTYTFTDFLPFYHYVDETNLRSVPTSFSSRSRTFTFTKEWWLDGVRCPSAETGNEYNLTLYPQMELGATATSFEPYQGSTYTISLGQTVYGGTLDMVTGQLVVDKVGFNPQSSTFKPITYYQSNFNSTSGIVSVRIDNSYLSYLGIDTTAATLKAKTISTLAPVFSGKAWNNTDAVGKMGVVDGLVFDYHYSTIGLNEWTMDGSTTVNAFYNTFGSSLFIVAPLASPQTYQLTPKQIKTLIGTNNVWASSGDIVSIKFTYGGLLSELPSEATEIVGKCYCDIEQNGVSSMPFTLNVKKNERES